MKQALLLMATSSLLVMLWVDLGFVSAPSVTRHIIYFLLFLVVSESRREF